MSPFSILLLGFAMSTDAFAAAVGKGAAMRDPRLPEALRAGAIFGTIEALTPLAGWALGIAAAPFVEAWDHWIAFVVLAALGLHMIVASLRQEAQAEAAPAETGKRHGLLALAATGLATSIDAMAVGVGLAFIDVNILVVAAVIGLCTLTMVTAGIMLGRALGRLVGRRAEAVGGLILIAIGVAILHEHLSGAA